MSAPAGRGQHLGPGQGRPVADHRGHLHLGAEPAERAIGAARHLDERGVADHVDHDEGAVGREHRGGWPIARRGPQPRSREEDEPSIAHPNRMVQGCVTLGDLVRDRWATGRRPGENVLLRGIQSTSQDR